MRLEPHVTIPSTTIVYNQQPPDTNSKTGTLLRKFNILETGFFFFTTMINVQLVIDIMSAPLPVLEVFLVSTSPRCVVFLMWVILNLFLDNLPKELLSLQNESYLKQFNFVRPTIHSPHPLQPANVFYYYYY